MRSDKISNLIHALNRAGMSCKAIAKRLGVSVTTVYAWRTGSAEPLFWTGARLVEMGEAHVENHKTLKPDARI